jgi:hypothetical protein
MLLAVLCLYLLILILILLTAFPESEPLLSKAESFATGHSLLVTPKSTWYGAVVSAVLIRRIQVSG